MSCSGSPTAPAPTRCSEPRRWTWTSCTVPARRTRALPPTALDWCLSVIEGLSAL
uniref:Uncharacterized protein n=1 Tax=Arundo donax TaxID=35708 RepID=A0A0A9D978_ARUDO